MIEPGSTIGMLGGGQLGRMLALAAAQLGYRVHIYAPARDSVAAEVASRFTCAGWDDREAMARFAADCAVMTYEFENVPVAPLQALPQGPLAPGVRSLECAQDRLHEKRFLEAIGGRTAPFMPVADADDLARAMTAIGAPGILKTRRDGYDGKGQWRFDSVRDADAIRLPNAPLIYEGLVRFTHEFSVVLVRGHDGAVRFWDSAHNQHEDGILASSTLPAPDAVVGQIDEARALAAQAARELGHVGVLTVEFFATADGPVANEIAPRVHNSGHWTIEGARTSQFENHIRAICGLPLGDTALTAPRMEMRNLIGVGSAQAAALLADPALHLHFYGKADTRDGRKMGHTTRLGYS